MDKLWVVVPVYNEEESVSRVVEEWLPVLRQNVGAFTFCLLNDGSKDGTRSILEGLATQHPEIYLVNKSNSGHGQTCVFGYRLAIENGADYVFQMDSDGQCDPRFFKEFWSRRQEHPVIYGFRADREDGKRRFLISRLVSLATWLATGVWVRDANVPYRLMSANSLTEILPKLPFDFHLVNILVSAFQQERFGIKWINIFFRQRIGGTASVKTYSFAKHGIKLMKQLRQAYIAPGEGSRKPAVKSLSEATVN